MKFSGSHATAENTFDPNKIKILEPCFRSKLKHRFVCGFPHKNNKILTNF